LATPQRGRAADHTGGAGPVNLRRPGEQNYLIYIYMYGKIDGALVRNL